MTVFFLHMTVRKFFAIQTKIWKFTKTLLHVNENVLNQDNRGGNMPMFRLDFT